MLVVLFTAIVVACSAVSPTEVSVRDQDIDVASILEVARSLKEEAVSIRQEAVAIRTQAFEAYMARSVLETTVVEALVLVLTNQATAAAGSPPSSDAREIIKTISGRMDAMFRKMEERISDIEGKLEEKTSLLSETAEKLERKASNISQKVSDLERKVDEKSSLIVRTIDEKSRMISEKMEESRELVTTVKLRQEAWLSEIRLISHFKVTGDTWNSERNNGYDADVAVDGQFVFTREENYMRIHTQSTNSANKKLWVDLGGLFKVSKIKIWNIRYSSHPAQIVGTHIYADDTLIGTARQSQYTYTFLVSNSTDVYASRITLHQPRAQYLYVIELQVWGCGPFLPDDLFV